MVYNRKKKNFQLKYFMKEVLIMEQENLNVDSFNSVNFLFARPAYQGHYYFALDV